MPEYRNATASLKENTAYVNEILPVQESFDIVQRNMMIGGREAAFFFVDGFTKDESMLKIIDSMMSDYGRRYAKECNGSFQKVISHMWKWIFWWGLTRYFIIFYPEQQRCLLMDTKAVLS